MTDIASLGIRIDSSQAASAATNLTNMGNAAKQAGQSVSVLTGLEHALERAVADINVAAVAAKNGTTSLANAHGNLSTQAMSAFHSVRSMAEGLALGMPPTQILTGQLNHLSYAASGPGGLSGAFKEVAASFAKVLTPTILVGGALALVAVASATAFASSVKNAIAFDDTARAAGAAASAIHGLESAAAFKGIGTPDFLKAMDHFAGSVYEAQHSMGGLAEVMRANGASASTFTGYLERAADLIKGASTDQQRLQLLQQMGLPPTMEWVRFLSQGAQGIRDAVGEAGRFGDAAEAQMVAKARDFEDRWNRSVKNWKTAFQDATLTVGGWLDTLSSKGTALLMMLPGIGQNVPTNIFKNAVKDGSGSRLSNGSDVSSFYAGTGAGKADATKTTVDPNVLKNQIALEQQHIGLLGQMATATDAVRSVELQVQAARLNGVSISNAQVETLKQLAREQSLGITAIKASTDAQNVEAQTVGMSTGKAAEYAAAQNAINEARRSGRALTPENIAAIKSEAAALGQAAQNADNLKWGYTNLVQGPLQTFTSAIQQGASAMEALKKAGQSALNAIANKLADMAASNLWSAAFGGSSGSGLGGLFGSLFGSGGVNAAGGIVGAVGPTSVGGLPLVAAGLHSGGGPGDAPTFTRYVHPAYFDDAPRFHSGIGPGEQAAIIRTDESVLTPGQMKQLSPVGGGVTINQYNSFTGNDPGTEARMRQAITQSKDQAVSEAVQAVAKIKGTSPGYLRAAR